MNTLAASVTSTPPLVMHLRTLFAFLSRFPQPILDLAFRVGIGAVFFKSALVKIQSWEATLGLFRDEYRVPLLPYELAATIGTTAELLCPTLIVFGLGARFGAAALLGMTFVIQVFVYPENWAEHLIWASLLGYIVTRGAGRLSIDHEIARSYRAS